MEKLLKEFAFLNDKQMGELVHICLKYIDTGEIQHENKGAEAFFIMHVKKKLDRIIKDRQRKKQKRSKRQ